MTARDPLHTLRSVSALDIVDGRYMAIFKGDPTFGENWLIGGNLDGNRVGEPLGQVVACVILFGYGSPNP